MSNYNFITCLLLNFAISTKNESQMSAKIFFPTNIHFTLPIRFLHHKIKPEWHAIPLTEYNFKSCIVIQSKKHSQSQVKLLRTRVRLTLLLKSKSFFRSFACKYFKNLKLNNPSYFVPF